MTPTEGKDSDSSEISYSHAFIRSVDSFGFFSPPPSVVVVDFTGTMKYN